MFNKRARLLLLTTVLVMLLLAGASLVSASGENIPGVPLPASPVAASIESTTSPHWVASIALKQSDRLSVSLTTTSTANFDLRLFSPWATDVADPLQQASYVLAASQTALYPEAFTYTAAGPGMHFIDVAASEETTGPFSLAYSLKHLSKLFISGASSRVTAYGGTASLTAKLLDVDEHAHEGNIRFYVSPNGTTWKYFKTVTTRYGIATLTVKPGSKTYYRARFLGDASFLAAPETPTVVVTPKVYLTAPSVPSSMVCNKAYLVSGYLKPRHASGVYYVRLEAQRYESGTWVTKRTVKAKNANYSTYTKYVGSLALNLPGKWRVRAYAPADTLHALTYTGFKYVSVPTQRAASVRCWVSDATPAQYDYVTAYAKVLDPYGKPIQGATVRFVWHYKATTPSETWRSGSSGVAECERWISRASKGYKVVINISASSGGNTVKGSTYFIPH